jgi:hypothetical protein
MWENTGSYIALHMNRWWDLYDLMNCFIVLDINVCTCFAVMGRMMCIYIYDDVIWYMKENANEKIRGFLYIYVYY